MKHTYTLWSAEVSNDCGEVVAETDQCNSRDEVVAQLKALYIIQPKRIEELTVEITLKETTINEYKLTDILNYE